MDRSHSDNIDAHIQSQREGKARTPWPKVGPPKTTLSYRAAYAVSKAVTTLQGRPASPLPAPGKHVIVVLIHIFLMTNDIEHLFMCLLAIGILSLVKCLLTFLDLFKLLYLLVEF
jgi:hypothetical protein